MKNIRTVVFMMIGEKRNGIKVKKDHPNSIFMNLEIFRQDVYHLKTLCYAIFDRLESLLVIFTKFTVLSTIIQCDNKFKTVILC